MDPRHAHQQQPPETVAGAPEGGPPPRGRRIPTQYVAVGLVLCVSVATLYAMRRYGTDEGIEFQHAGVNVGAVSTPIVDNVKFGRVMTRLASSNTPMQVPAEHIDKNPFRLERGRPAATETPVVDDSAERAAREAERLRLEAERRLSELNIAFSRLTLNTVMTGGRVPVARINNQIVGVGERVGEHFTVVDITSEGVEMLAEGHTFHLEVASMVNPRNTGPGGRTPPPSTSRPPIRRP